MARGMLAGSTRLATPALAAPAPNWTVDQAGSQLGFNGVMSGVGFTGVFHRWSAQIAFDPKALAASRVAVAVDVASAATGRVW